jgi:hypothetical protein
MRILMGLRKIGMESQYFDLIKFNFFKSTKEGILSKDSPGVRLLLS